MSARRTAPARSTARAARENGARSGGARGPRSGAKTVVVVTYTHCDPSVVAVIRAARRHARVFRLDADHFPMTVRLVVEEGGGDRGAARSEIVAGRHRVDLRDVTAVWFHQTWAGYTIPEHVDARLRAISQDHSWTALLGALVSTDAFLVDRFGHADHKPLQLRVAREVGLDTPRTVLTNDPRAVRRLAARCPDGVIAKSVDLVRLDEADHWKKVYTSAVSDVDLADLEGLRYCPMLFQERLPKARELRIVVAGRRVFAAAVDSQRVKLGTVDWRRAAGALKDAWTPYDLPPRVAQRLLRLMRRLDIHFGAIDMIVTPDGRHVFLEVNPNGGGFENVHRAGLPVAEGIADLLVGRAPRR